jgi:2-amino-4-hydroxy-6-hydroxymethyldihydropteridine diphosphokinase
MNLAVNLDYSAEHNLCTSSVHGLLLVAAMATIYLSLGSNQGDRARYIGRAIEALAEPGVNLLQESALYETEPVGTSSKSWFLNCVIKAETNLLPPQLMHTLLDIERSLGRRRRVLRGPRVIDMDILLYDDRVVSTDHLKIPHPRMAERRFVLVPFAEIAAEVRHPIFNKTIAELLAETPDRSEVRPYRSESKG